MARKKKEEKEKPPEKPKAGTVKPSGPKPMSGIYKFRVISGVFLMIFSLVLFFAFISHLFHWQADDSFQWSNLFSSEGKPAGNSLSRLGAVLSNTLMSAFFGLSSFSLPFLGFLFGAYLLTRQGNFLFRILIHVLFLTIWISVLSGFLFPSSQFLVYGPGGEIGHLIAAWFRNLAGTFGAFLLIFFAGFTYLAFAVEGSIHFLAKLMKSSLKPVEMLKKEKSGEITASSNPVQATKADTELVDSTPFTIEISDDEPIKSIKENSKNQKKSKINHQEDKELENYSDEEIESSSTDYGDNDFEVEKRHYEEYPLPPTLPPTQQYADSELIDEPSEEVPDEDFFQQGDYDPTADLSSYKYPPLSLLVNHKVDDSEVSKEELVANKNRIVETLRNYRIEIDKIKATIGPTITLYEIVPAPGVRISKIKNLEDDIALSLSALGIRIIAPIPGKGTIGIEVPNLKPEVVSMRSILSSQKFQESKYELPVAIGKTISNETYVFDLAKMPHLLVAGATGQGKSVGLNAIISSLLYKKHPSEIKFVLVDPKKVELTLYTKLEKHFLAMLPDSEEPIITDNDKVVTTLYSLTVEMDKRYDLLKKAQVRNLKEYNTKFISRKLNPHKGHRYLPYIVVVIDEFADLIMTAGKEVEAPIARIAQLARAIGIHLIIATQRPSTNVITGLIKANFPARIAFRVASMIDSRTILDHPGANQLIGRGDMLISQGSEMVRLQCAFIDTPEIEELVNFIGNQTGYPTAFHLPEVQTEGGEEGKNFDLGSRDDLFEEAARLLVIHQQGSTSLIQRKFSIGYNRAGRIMDQLEAANIVGPNEGSKARQVNYMDEFSLDQYLKSIL